MTKKIIVILTFVAILALMSTMFTAMVKPVKAAEQVTVVNHQGFLDSTGYYVVYGEVKNNGDTPAQNVYVKITFTSSSGPDEDEVETLIHVILPGRRAPFMGTASEQGVLSDILQSRANGSHHVIRRLAQNSRNVYQLQAKQTSSIT